MTKQQRAKLKPCPFCGATKLIVSVGPLFKVVCRNWNWCGIEGPRFIRRDEAIAAWNRRAGMRRKGKKGK